MVLFKDHKIIRVFGSPITPSILPIIVPNKLASLEAMHQLVEVQKSLVREAHKKGPFLPSQVVVGVYHFMNRKAYDILD